MKTMRSWTVTVELRDGSEATFVVQGDTASHAKNRLRNRVEIQFTKCSRPFAEGDEKYPKIG